ncbi:hypothetical protein [Streptomyces sp. NPDC088261]|uniref:hypothetical protein n=1 Tax=Streptomyces sp. NPDC088261 TaxID=3365851 RepID=UPI0038112DA9
MKHGNHTARFRLVRQLAKALSVPTPAVRKPGSAWTEPPRPVCASIAKGLVITTGAKRGQHPSPATVVRMLREHDERTT